MWQRIFVAQQKHCVTPKTEVEVSYFMGKLNDNDDDATRTKMKKEHYFCPS